MQLKYKLFFNNPPVIFAVTSCRITVAAKVTVGLTSYTTPIE